MIHSVYLTEARETPGVREEKINKKTRGRIGRKTKRLLPSALRIPLQGASIDTSSIALLRSRTVRTGGGEAWQAGAMDIILEILDTLLLDRVYATLWPASTASVSYQIIRQAAADAAAAGRMVNATFSSRQELPTGISYEYHPSSQYVQLRPSEWAYMSAWPRDHIFRQLLSVMSIGWCV